MSKALSEGLEYDPNHPSIIEELLQVRPSILIFIILARAWMDEHLRCDQALI